jgi:hypothetical protein
MPSLGYLPENRQLHVKLYTLQLRVGTKPRGHHNLIWICQYTENRAFLAFSRVSCAISTFWMLWKKRSPECIFN